MNKIKVNIRQPEVCASPEVLSAIFQSVKGWVKTLPLFLELGLDLSPLLKQARNFRLYKDIVILGVGGSCLGGKLLANFKPYPGPRLHFVDNIDSYEWNQVLEGIDTRTTGIIAISKSGNTTETLCQTLTILQAYANLPISEHFIFVTDPGESALRELSEYHNITCLDHPVGIGGRFSIFTVVGLLPALIAGIDVQRIVSGARNVVNEFLELGATMENPALTSAIFFDKLFKENINISVLFCYANRLLHFANWYSQLWAESLGKKSNTDEQVRYGTTPVIAIGTVDQHSQLQLYIDGPRDKVFTVITVGDHPNTTKIDVGYVVNSISRSLNGHMLPELMAAHQNVTIQTLLQNKSPLRRIHIPKYDEESLGEMIMFSILETLATGALWDIDPFNQPGVKNGKERVIEIMRN
jgi:glucose-6-phosphate isomerase